MVLKSLVQRLVCIPLQILHCYSHKLTFCSLLTTHLLQMNCIWLLVLLTFVLDKDNYSVGKDGSICAGKPDQKCFIVLFKKFVLVY